MTDWLRVHEAWKETWCEMNEEQTRFRAVPPSLPLKKSEEASIRKRRTHRIRPRHPARRVLELDFGERPAAAHCDSVDYSYVRVLPLCLVLSTEHLLRLQYAGRRDPIKDMFVIKLGATFYCFCTVLRCTFITTTLYRLQTPFRQRRSA